MGKKLDTNSRNILEFRPNIDFVEPEAEPAEITGIDAPQLEDITDQRREVKQLAKAVNVLATAIQAKADIKAQNMVIQLDPAADPAAIAAMNRKFPDADPTQITYAQYREAADDIRALANQIAQKALITPDEVAGARDDADKAIQNISSTAAAQMGGFGTEEARTGGLRPELQDRATIIPPLDIPSLQINLICILVNFIWKNFILPVFNAAKIPVANVSIGSLLPRLLCDPGADIEIPGLFMLGDDKVPDLLSGKLAEDAAAKAGT